MISHESDTVQAELLNRTGKVAGGRRGAGVGYYSITMNSETARDRRRNETVKVAHHRQRPIEYLEYVKASRVARVCNDL